MEQTDSQQSWSVSSPQLERRHRYSPDVAIFLLLIPFISAFNYYLTYSNIKLSWFLLLTFTIDTIQGYAAWWSVRALIFLMDEKMPIEKFATRRILFQIITTMIVGLAVIIVLTEMVSLIAKGKTAPLSFYTIDVVIISIWFFVINGIYIGLYYYNLWRYSQHLLARESRVKAEGLIVRQGKQDIRLSFDELTGFLVEDDYAVVVHQSGKRYLLDHSLDKVEKGLPSGDFFRLNRQYIIHQRCVMGFKRSENGKLLVQIRPTENFPEEVMVSRLKAPAFKAWFRPLS